MFVSRIYNGAFKGPWLRTYYLRCLQKRTMSDSVSNTVGDTQTATDAVDNTLDLRLNQFTDIAQDYGFQAAECDEIISKYQEVLHIPNYDLRETFSAWHRSQLGLDYMKNLIVTNPKFLIFPAALLERRLPLIQLYVKKPKSLSILLLQNPNLISERWEQVQEKICYLEDVMRVDKSEILKSSALSNTLSHIKLRHTLLLKCGLYETPSQYEHKRLKNEKSSFRNPPLKRIVDNEDVSFARKICKISHAEYEVYRKIFESGYFSDDELISDSDSDTDSD